MPNLGIEPPQRRRLRTLAQTFPHLIGQLSHDPYLFVVLSFATDEATFGLFPVLVPLADPGAW